MAAIHAETLGEALEKVARYKRLTCPEDVAIHVVRGEVRVQFQWLLADTFAPNLLTDGAFAGTLTLLRHGSGQAIAPKRIELTRRRANEAALKKFFGCEVRFDAPSDLLVFDEKQLTIPFTTHNPDVLALLIPGLEAALNKGSRANSLAVDVRTVLSRRIAGERPSIQNVAKDLGMSARSLQRRLEEIGTSYQTLLDEVRHRSARRLLTTTDLDPGEVAFLLGFQELNSFTRAFQSWERTTPIQWRSRQRRATS